MSIKNLQKFFDNIEDLIRKKNLDYDRSENQIMIFDEKINNSVTFQINNNRISVMYMTPTNNNTISFSQGLRFIDNFELQKKKMDQNKIDVFLKERYFNRYYEKLEKELKKELIYPKPKTKKLISSLFEMLDEDERDIVEEWAYNTKRDIEQVAREKYGDEYKKIFNYTFDKKLKIKDIGINTKKRYVEIWSYIRDGYSPKDIQKIMNITQTTIDNATVWVHNHSTKEDFKGTGF